MEKARYLILENGRIFKGRPFGADGEVTGEIVFTTSMTGYLETLTDPSFYGQIVVQTFPLIGNYGVIPTDFESKAPALKAYIVRDWCHEPSNFRCEGDLDTFLKAQGIMGLYDIDTRELTKIIREYGVMNARISDSPDNSEEVLQELRAYRIVDSVNTVSCDETESFPTKNARFKVVLWDFGAKQNIRRELTKRGCNVVVVPAGTKAEEILALKPDGIMLTNGPGDPVDNQDIIQELAKLFGAKVPTFGICLGHQLLALSQGAKSTKLKYGHRGANQPVKELATDRIFVTSQNHGYAIVNDSLPKTAKVSFINLNDGTCEGVDYLDMPVFSVQFHPEACGGPLDTRFLFDKFISLMEGAK